MGVVIEINAYVQNTWGVDLRSECTVLHLYIIVQVQYCRACPLYL
jgi:hypothetical protein